jgi:hypothetical protein
MAFSRADTDALYENSIHAALAARGIQPVRMDRIEHNDNVDDRVLTEIRTSDFAIVDLTYARPSVYYEAGFAEREIPVVYTIRRDHLTPRPDDEFGVFRLHFDLAMRNVIDWTSPDDEAFRVRLGSRLDSVVRPLLEADRHQREKEARREAFQALSLTERRQAVVEAADAFFVSAGYSPAGGISGLVYETRMGDPTYFRAEADTCRFVTLALSRPADSVPSTPPLLDKYNLNVYGGLNGISTVEEHWIFCAFHPIPIEAAAHANPSFRSIPHRGTLVEERMIEVPLLPEGFGGEVIPDLRPISISGYLVRGWLTRTPPDGTAHVSAGSHRFVHSGFTWRPITRVHCLHVFGALDSLDDLLERLKKAFLEPLSHGN